MYWQNRFERENPDEKLEKEILDIRKVHKDYGYRRIWGELRNRNIFVNKKKVQRIVQKLNLQVTSFTHKSRKYSSYKGKVGKIAPNRITVNLTQVYRIRKSQQIQVNLSIMRLTARAE